MRDESWFRDAACRGSDPNLFFPYLDDQYNDEGVLTASAGEWPDYKFVSALCGSCDMKDKCLDYVMALPINEEGFWAGTRRATRKKIREMQAGVSPSDEWGSAIDELGADLNRDVSVCL